MIKISMFLKCEFEKKRNGNSSAVCLKNRRSAVASKVLVLGVSVFSESARLCYVWFYLVNQRKTSGQLVAPKDHIYLLIIH